MQSKSRGGLGDRYGYTEKSDLTVSPTDDGVFSRGPGVHHLSVLRVRRLEPDQHETRISGGDGVDRFAQGDMAPHPHRTIDNRFCKHLPISRTNRTVAQFDGLQT